MNFNELAEKMGLDITSAARRDAARRAAAKRSDRPKIFPSSTGAMTAGERRARDQMRIAAESGLVDSYLRNFCIANHLTQ